jgi:hypothetical protein
MSSSFPGNSSLTILLVDYSTPNADTIFPEEVPARPWRPSRTALLPGDLMTCTPLSKAVLAATLAAVLAVPAVSAAPHRAPSASPAGASFSFTDAILRFLGSVTGLLKEGAGIDPSGRSGAQANASTQDAGCGIDPSGRCVTPGMLATQDAGCGVDPNGKCSPGH